MLFEWHKPKNEANFKKHGVWFEEAQTVWADARAIEFFDPDNSDREDRFIRLGFSGTPRLLLVVFCERLDGQVVRKISARKATKKEVQAYEKRI